MKAESNIGTFEFAISASWLEKWNQFIDGTIIHPGPINNKEVE